MTGPELSALALEVRSKLSLPAPATVHLCDKNSNAFAPVTLHLPDEASYPLSIRSLTKFDQKKSGVVLSFS